MPGPRETSPPGRPVASVARALALLDELCSAPDGLGVNELARRIGVNASTASRLLATLEAGRMVEGAPGGPYRLGLRLVALADGVLSRLDVRELARPRLRALVAATGETATLSVPGAGEAVTVDFVAAESSVMSVARLGRPSVGHATAAGKIVLAFGDALAAAVPSGPLAPLPDRTIVDRRALAAQIHAARSRPRSTPCARAGGPRRRASASRISTRSRRRCSAGPASSPRSSACRGRRRG